jgi:hypothetical protein
MLGVAGATSLFDCSGAPIDTPDQGGDQDWPSAQAYVWPMTVSDTLTLYASSTAPWFFVEVYSINATTPIAVLGPFAGVAVARGAFDAAWEWPRYDIPLDLPSGLYVGVMRRCDDSHAIADAPPSLASANGEMKVLFIVRRNPTSSILYKLPLFTYQAYNETGGGSLYAVWDRVRVSLRRPGGGTGHTKVDGRTWQLFADELTDPFGCPGDLQWNTFEHWDAKMIRWLLARGYDLDYCTDWDLHTNPDLVAPYRLLVSVGHDEYWSAEMRDQVESFIGNGGNVAWFAGNTAFWRVEVDVEQAVLKCDKTNNYVDHWNLQGRPENYMTGMSMHAGGYTSQDRAPLGFTIVAPESWPFAGVGESTFGEAGAIVGYEVDGAPVDASLQLTYADDTPPNFHVLAQAVLPTGNPSPDGWYTTPPPQPGVAMIGLYSRVGTVFNAGVTDWARVLASGDATTEKITANVFDRLSKRRLSCTPTAPVVQCDQPVVIPQPILDSFRDQEIVAFADCGTLSVVATADGNLYEIAITDGRVVRDVLPYFGRDRQSRVAALVRTTDGVVVVERDGSASKLVWHV